MKAVRKTGKYERILSRTFLFRGLDARVAASAFRSPDCACLEFQPGEKVYTRAAFQRSVGVVLSGRLKAVKSAPGGPDVVLNTFQVGGIFGVAGLFSDSDRYVSEIAAVRLSRVLFLPQALLRELFRREPSLAENYIVFLSDRIRYLNSCIDHFTGGSAESRLAEFLLALGEDGARKLMLPCPMTQLAATLGIGRASLYRAFDALSRRGLVRRTGREVELLDPAGLRGARD